MTGRVVVIARTKFFGLMDAGKMAGKYELYDYKHIRPAKDDEQDGVILTKNDLKRK